MWHEIQGCCSPAVEGPAPPRGATRSGCALGDSTDAIAERILFEDADSAFHTAPLLGHEGDRQGTFFCRQDLPDPAITDAAIVHLG